MTVVEGAELLGPSLSCPGTLSRRGGAAEVILLVYESALTKLFSPETRRKVGFLRAGTTSLAPWERKGWIMTLAKGMNVRLSDDGAAFLAEMLDDPGELRSEVDKARRYAAGEVVTGDMVKNLSFDEGKSRMLSFLDAFCTGRAGGNLPALSTSRKTTAFFPLSLPCTTGSALLSTLDFFLTGGDAGASRPPDQGIPPENVQGSPQALFCPGAVRPCFRSHRPFLGRRKPPRRKAGSASKPFWPGAWKAEKAIKKPRGRPSAQPE